MITALRSFLYLACLITCAFAGVATGQSQSAGPVPSNFKPYVFFHFENDSPKDHNYGAFHYTNVQRTLPPDMVGRYYQSGLFHTWYRPDKIYGLEDFDRKKYGYHAMEGGVGYKPYLRFRTDANPHKFTTGAVAGGFESFSNGPLQGAPGYNRTKDQEALGWEKNVGRYGAAQLSNCFLYPIDGVTLETDTNNQMLGYGYYALPLTEPKATTAGSDIPTGNHCWTLFLHTKNFSGPVCFFTPYHWSKYSLTNDKVIGQCLDNSLLKANSRYQRETNVIPAKKWEAPDGDTYYRTSVYTMPADGDNIGRFGAMPMTLDSTKWEQFESWFSGGSPAPTEFGQIGKEIHVRKFKKASLAFKLDKKIRVSTGNFATSRNDKDESAAAFEWHGDLVKRFDSNLVQMPEYYRLKKGAKAARAIPESDVPKQSKLTGIKFPEDSKKDFRFSGFISDPIETPLHPGYKFKNEITNTWTKPGPTAGPFVTKLSDGSQVVYYWYKFNEQPAILNSDMDQAERELVQKRVELMHKHWSIKDKYFPDPAQPLASVDQGVIVTPPKGLEVGYVPICAHQQKADQKLPKFTSVKRKD